MPVHSENKTSISDGDQKDSKQDKESETPNDPASVIDERVINMIALRISKS